ncbi:MAG: EF-P lysine aminoacylase EpmA [bacterium]|nr:EF-P lysine aminoacylase EpmA [bacterium]
MERWQFLKENQQARDMLIRAAAIRAAIRQWFINQGFLEVNTPSLVRAAGQEPYLDPFEVAVRDERGNKTPGFLVTSPEYALKKLLVAGFPKIFSLASAFRNNEPADEFHNPEFTMLEWYRAGSDYRGIMEDTEQLVSSLARTFHSTGCKTHRAFNFSAPWERLTVAEAFLRHANIDLDEIIGELSDFAGVAGRFRDVLQKRGERVRGDETFDECFFKIFLTYIEQKLGRGKPTFLYDYPASMASLARLKKEDTRYAERVEVYIEGVELANGFSELCDENEQRSRFLEEQEIRLREGKAVHPIDESFLAALGSGMPESSGIALGVDRLIMLLLDAKSIRDVLFFPW